MKIGLTILTLVIFISSFGQKLTVTPAGLRDERDTTKTFVVLETDSLTAKQLFDNAKKYITENYKNPKEVIKGETDAEYLKFDTFVPELLQYPNGPGSGGPKIPIKATYTTELRFKDGKVRYEITSLDMTSNDRKYRVLFSGGLLEGYIIYKKNGQLYKEGTKADIENYFNANINLLLTYLNGKSNKKSDW
jgi:hypothetical protein